MSIEPTLLEQTTQETPENTAMSTNHNTLKPSELMVLKICSALGVLGFTAFMVNSWQTQLAAYDAAQATKAQAETAQTTTPPAVVAPVATATPTQEMVASTTTPPTQKTLATNTSEVPETTSPMTKTVTETPLTEMAVEPAVMNSEKSITDQAVLAQLNQKLYETIDTNWKQLPTFSKSLVYQVKVAEDGDITEYESLNSAASEYAKETPLPSLTDAQQTEISAASPLAKFLVVMTPTGTLEVSPWVAEN